MNTENNIQIYGYSAAIFAIKRVVVVIFIVSYYWYFVFKPSDIYLFNYCFTLYPQYHFSRQPEWTERQTLGVLTYLYRQAIAIVINLFIHILRGSGMRLMLHSCSIFNIVSSVLASYVQNHILRSITIILIFGVILHVLLLLL